MANSGATGLLCKEMDQTYVRKLLKDKQKKKPNAPWRALVMVMGDMGHSPRMQYHVSSLAREGFLVDFLGYQRKQL